MYIKIHVTHIYKNKNIFVMNRFDSTKANMAATK